ncbi:hypothetical protein E2C01_081940 [Portunus trituberculatus]|uniref:Uncharacterized protein n=1 Tax=Portunus trituberculatus TaxID=210409 RepID=A0A5B7IXT6_PORTR|nr:hypothetical protein [Portunus trituberculatus]
MERSVQMLNICTGGERDGSMQGKRARGQGLITQQWIAIGSHFQPTPCMLYIRISVPTANLPSPFSVSPIPNINNSLHLLKCSSSVV